MLLVIDSVLIVDGVGGPPGRQGAILKLWLLDCCVIMVSDSERWADGSAVSNSH